MEIYFLWCLCLCFSVAETTRGNRHKPWIEAEYQGIVMENDQNVLLNPPLFALDKDSPTKYTGEICGFKIHGSTAGFEALVVDKSTGEGLVRAREKLDCETQREHTFTVQAQDCGENAMGTNVKKSHKATVHIRVNDVNEFAPEFLTSHYQAWVREGKLYPSILKIEARDRDCSPQYSQICYYHLLTPNTPFAIDSDGNLKNTELLAYEKQKDYHLDVTAYDCGKKRASRDATIDIEVRPTCTPRWIGWSKRIEYVPGSGRLALLPDVSLETCDHKVSNILVTLAIETDQVAKGCDRDNYSERAIRKLCGALPGEIELLPSPSQASNWTSGLHSHYSPDSSQTFLFNGSVSVLPPPSLLPPSLGDQFTLSLWLKRGPGREGGEEEAILCHTFLFGDSYSHYSLSLSECRLSFVHSPNLLQPLALRFTWKLEQVCDSLWHHYALCLEATRVTLYVDGVTYDPVFSRDDRVFRSHTPQTSLSVGACRSESNEGGLNNTETKEMGSYLLGSLAGLSVREGGIEPREVIQCLYSCKEGLDFTDFQSLGKGMKLHVNPSQSVLVMEGSEPVTLSRAIASVTYHNSLRYATPGVRAYTLTTTLRAASEESLTPHVPSVEGYVLVLQPDAPQISVSGPRRLARPLGDFLTPQGSPVFNLLTLTCSVSHSLSLPPPPASQEQDTLLSDEIIHSLDSCEVFVVGDGLEEGRERLVIDPSIVAQKGLQVSQSRNFLTLSGIESLAVYEEVLRDIGYHLEPDVSVYERRFRVSCSEMNGRYSSNEFTLEVSVLHSLTEIADPSYLKLGEEFVRQSPHSHSELTGHSPHPTPRGSVIPSAVTVVFLVCGSLLLLMLTLGILRVRFSRVRTAEKVLAPDSPLTVIVNPMESYQSPPDSRDMEDENESEKERENERENERERERRFMGKESRHY